MDFIKIIGFLLIALIFCSCQNKSNKNEKNVSSKPKTPVSEYELIDLTSASSLDAKQDWVTIHNKKTVPLSNGGEYIAAFSIRNNSDYRIKDIYIRLISYDRNDQPIDFKEYRFLRNGLPPGLAKEIPYKRPPDYYVEKLQAGSIEFEILGFKVKRQ